MSSTYCLCCGGHIKHFLEILLGKKVEVKFISSALSSYGKKNCQFELKEINEK
jgi:predicted hydrocarbon binding protein